MNIHFLKETGTFVIHICFSNSPTVSVTKRAISPRNPQYLNSQTFAKYYSLYVNSTAPNDSLLRYNISSFRAIEWVPRAQSHNLGWHLSIGLQKTKYGSQCQEVNCVFILFFFLKNIILHDQKSMNQESCLEQRFGLKTKLCYQQLMLPKQN